MTNWPFYICCVLSKWHINDTNTEKIRALVESWAFATCSTYFRKTIIISCASGIYITSLGYTLVELLQISWKITMLTACHFLFDLAVLFEIWPPGY